MKTILFLLLLSTGLFAQSVNIDKYTVVYSKVDNKHTTFNLSILENGKDIMSVKNAEYCIAKIEELCDCCISDNLKYQITNLDNPLNLLKNEN